MPARSVRSQSRAGSSVKGGKGGPKKAEKCATCDKEHKDMRLLECSHAFCPDCLKLIAKEPAQNERPGTKDGRASKASTRGGKKGAPAVKVQYVCSVCNPPEPEPEPEPEPSPHGFCAPCEFVELSSCTF